MDGKADTDTSRALELVLETMLDAGVVMDAKGKVSDWNTPATNMFGWTRREAIGLALADLIIPHRYREAHVLGLARYLEGGHGEILGRRVELAALRRDGAEFPVELAVSAIPDKSGPFFLGCLRDITAEQNLRESAKVSERQFQILVQGVKDYAIYMLDPNGHIQSWNAGAEHIKGYKADEVVGRHFSLFYTPEDQEADLPTTALQQAGTAGKFEAEGWRVRKDGRRFWASVVIDPLYSEGKLLGFAKITRDITEKLEFNNAMALARERLFQSQKLEAIGQLTGGVAHDFNNLLTVVIGSIDIARKRWEEDTPASRAQIGRLLTSAVTGAKRAASLTQRLLAFARRQPLDPKPLDLNRFIAGLVDFLQRTLGEQIEIEAVGGGGVWNAEIDSVQLESVVLNLALNARDAMPGGGKLTLETSNTYLDEEYCRANPEVKPGQYVLLAVSDTGGGMPPEVLSQVFEPFFTTKPVGQGTGLGLSQVYGFVKQSGGHVKLYSELGRGTSVKIYLPRLPAGLLPIEEIPSSGTATQGNETILVVEDEQAVLDYIDEILRDLGYNVLRANDGNSAIEQLRQNATSIDLLLTDVVLPGVDGRKVANEARRLKSDIKVLFMTGYSRNAIVHHGRLDPGVHLIQKPVSQDNLATRIRDLLDSPTVRDD